MSRGAAHVALSSITVLPVLATPRCNGVKPMDRRKVMNCPENERTVRYSRDSEKEGRNAECLKYPVKDETGTMAARKVLKRVATEGGAISCAGGRFVR